MRSTSTAASVPRAARRRLRAATLLAAALGVTALAAPPAALGQGGTIRVLSVGDVDALDPAVTYTSGGISVAVATQRPLLAYRPEDASRAVPDLAAAAPEVSPDGLTVTVRLKAGVRFSPPVDREVTSADVKYAIERGFFSSVGSPYASLYFADIAGARADVPPGTQIPGIETPDERTVVFRLARPRAGALVAAMVMPLTAPVPREHAAPLDARRRSAYATRLVATGAYMVRTDAAGRTVGHRPGRRLHLVRNPRWDAATDFRPAAVDALDIRQGNEDALAASRRILRGRRMVGGDISPPLRELRRELRARPGQFRFVSSGLVTFATLNTSLAPFDDADVRRAVVAGFDRRAVLRQAGGRLAGQVATHFIPPDVPGFAEAGGQRGPGLDFVSRPEGSRRVAARYLRRAGFEGGRYTGRRPVVVVVPRDEGGRRLGRHTRRQLERLGFRVRLRALQVDRAFELCQDAEAAVHSCPGWGWYRDFPDAQSVLDPLFNSASIGASGGNNNVSQLRVPAIDAALEAAKALTDPLARAAAWGAIDRQVTAEAPGVPLLWPRVANIRSRDVTAVASRALGGWDLSYLALR
jgi:peptide/nickel transport system substrate-binding protein